MIIVHSDIGTFRFNHIHSLVRSFVRSTNSKMKWNKHRKKNNKTSEKKKQQQQQHTAQKPTEHQRRMKTTTFELPSNSQF